MESIAINPANIHEKPWHTIVQQNEEESKKTKRKIWTWGKEGERKEAHKSNKEISILHLGPLTKVIL
jgi:hypothetical protein